MPLSDRFTDALAFAERLHRSQKRKGNDIPYVAHLLAVCATVLEHGGDEDTAIAALLHDAVEDQGGLKTLEAIRARYGERVANIVSGCTDSVAPNPAIKAPWRERKVSHINHLRSATSDVALVTAADKLHNLNAQIRDVRRQGATTMARFNASPEDIIWYNLEIASAISAHRDVIPYLEMEEATATLARLLGVAIPSTN